MKEPDEELDLLLKNRVLASEEDKRNERISKGLWFLCDRGGGTTNPKSFPKSPHKLFRLAPLIGAIVKEQRLAAIARLRAFRPTTERRACA